MAIIEVTYLYSILLGHFVVKYQILGSFCNIEYMGMPSIFNVKRSGSHPISDIASYCLCSAILLLYLIFWEFQFTNIAKYWQILAISIAVFNIKGNVNQQI